MTIHQNFTGGNIAVDRIENDTVYLERELRDTEGDWFYWAFCAEGFAGHTITFVFPNSHRVGRFGAAVSYDLKAWHWSESGQNDRFTYSFAEDEDRVYFAHNMVYEPSRFNRLCEEHHLTPEVFCRSVKGRELPAVRFGTGEKWILLTARHHACESTGSYVLEGMTESLLNVLPEGYSVLVIPFVDYDGVLDGDQGKNRTPHDHNRDYIDSPIYEVVEKMMAFGRENNLVYTFDFHSPWHMENENDYVFFSRSTEAMELFTDRFGEYLKRETAGNELKYTGEWDVGPNEKWNDENSPNSKNYFSKQPGMKLSVTTETPYFGVNGGKITVDAMLELGRAFGRAAAAYIRENEENNSERRNDMNAKNIMIFGDSYSTFAGYIPEGYAIYYSSADRPETDVRKVEETWWHRVSADLGLNVVQNNSWSGSTLCNTGYSGDCSMTNSFLHRLDLLNEEGFFDSREIDTVFIFGCTNDSWANAPLGEIKFGEYTKEDLASVLPAICCFIGKVKESLPEANIIFLINTDLKPQIGEAVKAASEYHGTSYIELQKIDKRCGHPTVQGMKDIADAVEAFLQQ